MKLLSTLASLSAFALLLLAGCSQQSADGIVSVAENDPEMTAAIAKARQTLPQFWQTLEKPQAGESDFALKVKITDRNGTEYFWVNELERREGTIFGVINNDPEIVKKVKLGQKIVVPEADISDWTYLREEKMHGNYTMRALFKHMPEEEAKKYKAMLAEP